MSHALRLCMTVPTLKGVDNPVLCRTFTMTTHLKLSPACENCYIIQFQRQTSTQFEVCCKISFMPGPVEVEVATLSNKNVLVQED